MQFFSVMITDRRELLEKSLNQVLLKREESGVGEEFRISDLNDTYSLLTYNPGNFSYYSDAFAVSCEYFFIDDIVGSIAELMKKDSEPFTLFGVISAYFFMYDVVKKYTRDSFKAVACVDGTGEKILMENGSVVNYETKDFDTSSEESQLKDQENFYTGFYMNEIDYSFYDFEQEFKKCLKNGKLIWPEKTKTGDVIESAYANYPIIPMFDYMT